MNTRHRLNRALATLPILLLAGCAGPPSPATPTPSPPTASAAAALPSLSPSATPFPTPTPTPNPMFLQLWQQQRGQILFWSDGNLCLLTGSATPVYLADAQDVSFARLSPDGTLIAVIRSHNSGWSPGSYQGLAPFEISVIDSIGGEPRILLTSDQLNLTRSEAGKDAPIAITQVEWVPGAHRLIFSTIETIQGYTYGLHSLDADTGGHHVILDTGHGGNFWLSPKGQRIALVTPDSIGLMNSDGTDWQPDVFVYPPIMTYSDSPGFVHPTWTDDSHGLYVAVPPRDPQGDDTTVRTWLIPADGKQPPVPMMTFDQLRINFFGAAVVSPSGLYMAATTFTPGKEDAALRLLDMDGGRNRLVYPGFVVFEGWDADSQHFLFRTAKQPYDWYRGYVEGGYAHVTPPRPPAQGCHPG